MHKNRRLNFVTVPVRTLNFINSSQYIVQCDAKWRSYLFHKRPSIKDVRSQGFVQCGHFADKGGGKVLQMRTSARFGTKTSDFSKFMVCPHGQGGLSQCGHFSDKRGGGQFFEILCVRLLWTAPYSVYKKNAYAASRSWKRSNFIFS